LIAVIHRVVSNQRYGSWLAGKGRWRGPSRTKDIATVAKLFGMGFPIDPVGPLAKQKLIVAA
jgi:hypothetical protein